MRIFRKNSDSFFYFFAFYSVLFVVCDYYHVLWMLQIFTYLGLLIFFCVRLNQYFWFILDNKEKAEKLSITKSQKKLKEHFIAARKNLKEGLLILSFSLLTFVLIAFLADTNNKSNYQISTFWKQIESGSKVIAWKSTQTIIAESSFQEKVVDGQALKENDITDLSNEENVQERKKIIDSWDQEAEIKTESAEPIIADNTKNQKTIKPADIPGNLSKESSDTSLSLNKNFNSQVKDVYDLQPFTKYGSDFLNILKLQKVLNKLWYYSWVADGAFNFETKLAIYNTLVFECSWPAETTKWVFGPQAKLCIDNLYIKVEDWESDWLIE